MSTMTTDGGAQVPSRQRDARGTTTTRRPAVEIARVGHDNGRLVLRFERRLASPPPLVSQAVVASQRVEPTDPGHTVFACPTGVALRWEVEAAGKGSRLVFTTWIEAADVDRAANAGSALHAGFEGLVRSIDPGAAQPLPGAGARCLAAKYSLAFAAALADAD